eukprot:COSAG05_NODE_19214_length_296_cov_0.771574_1_plen_31_part_10
MVALLCIALDAKIASEDGDYDEEAEEEPDNS